MEFINLQDQANASGHYSPGVRCGNTLYIAGQLSIDPATGKKPEGGFQEEVRQALRNVESVLRSAGFAKENVAMCRVYILGKELWPQFNEVYMEFFKEHKPARIVVPVAELNAGCMVEIEAVASIE